VNFQELLRKVNYETFKQVLVEHHVKPEEQVEYQLFIQRLLEKTPKKEPGVLTITKIPHDDWVEYEAGLEKDGDSYALDFVPWEIVLGYDVNEDHVNDVSIEEFVFAALYDMSFDGFYEKQRQEQIDKYNARLEEKGQNLTSEEMWAKVEELKKKLENKEE